MTSMKNWAVLGVSILMAVPAFAGDEQTRGLSWGDFKEACSNPARFGSQRAPQNVKVMCTNQQTQWVAIASGEVNLSAKRQLTISITSDKYHVSPLTTEAPAYAGVGSCSRFKEVTETYTAPERVVTCDELLGFKGELADFCAAEVDRGKDFNPKLTQVQDTGRVMDTCAGLAIKNPPAVQ